MVCSSTDSIEFCLIILKSDRMKRRPRTRENCFKLNIVLLVLTIDCWLLTAHYCLLTTNYWLLTLAMKTQRGTLLIVRKASKYLIQIKTGHPVCGFGCMLALKTLLLGASMDLRFTPKEVYTTLMKMYWDCLLCVVFRTHKGSLYMN